MGVAKYVKNNKDAVEEVILQSGIKVKTKYGPEDLEEIGFDYDKDLGPGVSFTRGIHPKVTDLAHGLPGIRDWRTP
jgi:methylmalonyl-CoA mutase N-terminal domain/subunit